MNSGQLVITIFDVGHGDHILVQFPDGKIGIIDACIPDGHDEPPVLPVLRTIRETRGHNKKPLPVEFLCITHPHDDHVRGLYQILTDPAVTVKEVWHSLPPNLDFALKFINETAVKSYSGSEPISELVRVASPMGELLDTFRLLKDQKKSTPLVDMRILRVMQSLGGVEITCVSPSDKAVNRYTKRIEKDIECKGNKATAYANRLSIALVLTYGAYRVLLSGDVVRANWREAMQWARDAGRLDSLFPINLLKAAHHGASNGFYRGLWDVVLAGRSVVVVSSGGGQHPAPAFLNQLPRASCKYCTNFGLCGYSHSGSAGLPLGPDLGGSPFKEIRNKPCCGTVEVTVWRNGRIKVTPDRHRECCHACG